MMSPVLLNHSQRLGAFAEADKLAALSPRVSIEPKCFPSSIARLSQLCADACLPESADGTSRKLPSASFRPVSSDSQDWTSLVLVFSGCFDNQAVKTDVGFVVDAMGAGGLRELTDKQHQDFISSLHRASLEISRVPKLAEVVILNTGTAYPYLCEAPSIGSGSALQIPGAMLLPAGVPSIILAECWIHEALHTELHLAEWLEGTPQATADKELETPWRTVERPAALLLHGAFVFSTLLHFIKIFADKYSEIPRDWELSATRGKKIPVCEVGAVIDFRKHQIQKAIERLEIYSTFSPIGLQVMTHIKTALQDF
jgi:hypothetical protein